MLGALSDAWTSLDQLLDLSHPPPPTHTDRPAYLFLKHALRDKLGVRCILGLTGTIVPAAKTSICSLLQIEPRHVVQNQSVLRTNLQLSISRVQASDNREGLLVSLLKTPTFAALPSIIVYTMFQVWGGSM